MPSPAIRAGQIRVDKSEPGNNQGPLRRLDTEHKLPSKHGPAGRSLGVLWVAAPRHGGVKEKETEGVEVK